ncbi:hypothetical protein SAMN06269117_11367 [Balnearium lithotrophicum]|uniref:Phage recombination protein Bet n=1 Tax=Balnearium lithotrophicum TaxID=223788 RepID=A0A521CKA4_9BACT|nr:hypothetical protein [Balnearium lithotrophicum]SMO59867.1 hypothetical protein SAMN06269117_11367 [Balnearium lithotrophicum]
MSEVKTTADQVRIKVAEELQEQWLDLTRIKGWLKGHKGIPEKAQEHLAQQIRALFAEFGLRPDLGHIIVMGDRPYITKEGLIYYAQKSGQLAGIEVEIVERTQNFCLMKATVRTKDGGKYEAYGDADKNNTNRTISPHLIRMAETRAVNRALRVAFPIGLCSYEELAEQDILYDPETGEVIEEKRQNNNRNGDASDRQVNAIKTIADKRKLSEEQLREFLKLLVNKEKLEELDKEEASKVITELNKLAPKQILIEIQNTLKGLGIKNGEKKKLYQTVIGKSTSKLFTEKEAQKFLEYLKKLKQEKNGKTQEGNKNEEDDIQF